LWLEGIPKKTPKQVCVKKSHLTNRGFPQTPKYQHGKHPKLPGLCFFWGTTDPWTHQTHHGQKHPTPGGSKSSRGGGVFGGLDAKGGGCFPPTRSEKKKRVWGWVYFFGCATKLHSKKTALWMKKTKVPKGGFGTGQTPNPPKGTNPNNPQKHPPPFGKSTGFAGLNQEVNVLVKKPGKICSTSGGCPSVFQKEPNNIFVRMVSPPVKGTGAITKFCLWGCGLFTTNVFWEEKKRKQKPKTPIWKGGIVFSKKKPKKGPHRGKTPPPPTTEHIKKKFVKIDFPPQPRGEDRPSKSQKLWHHPPPHPLRGGVGGGGGGGFWVCMVGSPPGKKHPGPLVLCCPPRNGLPQSIGPQRKRGGWRKR